MKSLIFVLLLIAPLHGRAQSKSADEHEINRRNFVSLNSDLSELKLIVHYPGGSPITEVCGIQLRTNIAFFANSHMESFIKEIQVTDDNGKEVVAVQRVAEPPVYGLESVNSMHVSYKVRTKSGKSLRTVIRKAAESENLKFDREPEIIAIAKHCKDNS